MNQKENRLLEKIWEQVLENSNHISEIKVDVAWIKKFLFVLVPALIGGLITLWLKK